MRIIQTKGIVTNGEVNIKVNQEFSNGEIDVILVAKDEPDEFEIMRLMAKSKGYDSQEKIMELIKQVKLEILEEKGKLK